MPSTESNEGVAAPVLLCFDGSDQAEHAIERAAALFAGRRAVVLTVAEPVRAWEPSDPSPLGALVVALGAKPLGLDEIEDELALERLERGVSLARSAGFEAEGKLVHGRPWRAICETAAALDADAIVLGARGMSPAKSALLGSVSAEVAGHAGRPVLIVPPVSRAEPGER